MKQYIGDDFVVLQLAGLRWISKENHSWGDRDIFTLTWNYKGAENHMNYNIEEARNEMYERVKAALLERNKDKQETK